MSFKDDKLWHDAQALDAAGDIAAAAQLLERLLRRQPTHLAAATRLAELDIGRERYAEAADRLRRVLRINPAHAPAAAALATACWLLGETESALDHALRAVARQPENPRFHLLLAQVHHRCGELGQARAILQQEIAQAPSDQPLRCELHAELARVFDSEGCFRTALDHFQQANRLDPSWVDAHFGHAVTLLRCGDFTKGWREFEFSRASRFAKSGAAPIPPEFFWDGSQDLRGQTLLIFDDTGFGDAIQFFRYLPLLRARGARLAYVALPSLVPLFRAAAPDVQFLPTLAAGTRFNYICLSHSLPAVFNTTLQTIPTQIPYLETDPDRVRRCAPGLAAAPGLRVGLAWAGNPKYLYDYRRSIPATTFLEIADDPPVPVSFFSLQTGIKPADRAALEQRPTIRRLGEKLADFADTAAILSHLDLLITTDTSIAHLAGALGRPVWLVLGAVPDWRWLLDRQDSPWYPSMRLFRQTRPGPWAEVLRRVRQEWVTLATELVRQSAGWV